MDPTGIVVEPPDDGPPPNRRRRWIMIEVGAIAVAAAVGGFLGWQVRGDDDQVASAPAASTSTTSSVSASTAPPATTGAPSTTSAAATTTTTVAATTSTSSTTTSTTTTSTTTTTTLPPLATATDASLVAALPAPGDLPAGWLPDPGGPEAGLDPGFGLGFCGGPVGDQRAIDTGAVAAASSYAEAPGPAYHELRLVGFPTPEDAANYMTATRNQIDGCSGGITYRIPEGDGIVGTFDGFIDEDPPITWTITEAPRSTDVDVAGADDVYRVEFADTYAATLDGAAYGWKSTGGTQYERYGSVVIINILYSDYDVVGFEDADEYRYVTSLDELIQAADHLRAPTLDRLRQQSLIR